MLSCFPRYASPDQNSLVKSVIHTYEIRAQWTCHTKRPAGIVEGGREKFPSIVLQVSCEKMSDARLTQIYTKGIRIH